MKFLRPVALSLLCSAFFGCAGSYQHTLSFNPAEPNRIAVLPFAQVDEKGSLVQADENFLIDNVALVSSKLTQTPAQFVQTQVQTELAKASLDMVSPAIVEAALVHNGFTIPESKPVSIDLAKVFAASPQEICSKLLSCDAVLYGKIVTWDRSYYAIQTISTVALELKIVSARNGKVLFETLAKDSDSRGITKGPTGFSNLVLEPIKGLDNSIITALADDIVEQALSPLNRWKKPEFLNVAPPAIIATAHDAQSGIVPRSGKLVVIVYGSPGQTGTFSIGNAVADIPLTERSPGHYIGEYIPLSTDRFTAQSVAVSLRDEAGRKTNLAIPGQPITIR